MNSTIRLLYAESNTQDADQTRFHFAGHAPEFELLIVDTGAAFLEQSSATRPTCYCSTITYLILIARKC
jgi:hypothetical protein